MRVRTKELLYFLLWTAEQLARPTFYNLSESFEGWAYRRGFLRQLHELERLKFLERKHGAAEAVFRLSESGRVLALGGRDPVEHWNRSWDGQWRMVMFDLPETKATARKRLRRFLKDHQFGYLQKSVWISPDPLNKVMRDLSLHAKDVESLVTFIARPAAAENDSDIVAGAWDFEEINRRYQICLEVLGRLPQPKPRDHISIEQLQRWGQLERSAWVDAISVDPLLPTKLLPSNYLGKEVWKKRICVLAAASRLRAR